MPTLANRFAADTSGATAVEYALLAIMMGVPLLALSTPLRTQLVALLSGVVDGFVLVLGEADLGTAP
jgi:Flp pilus assembly pilin Flp